MHKRIGERAVLVAPVMCCNFSLSVLSQNHLFIYEERQNYRRHLKQEGDIISHYTRLFIDRNDVVYL